MFFLILNILQISTEIRTTGKSVLLQHAEGCNSSISSSTFIDSNESYKQISCVEHFYMCSNIFNKHICLLQET